MSEQIPDYFREFTSKYKESYEPYFHRRVSEIFMMRRDLAFLYKGGAVEFSELYGVASSPMMFLGDDGCYLVNDVVKFIKQNNIELEEDDIKMMNMDLETAGYVVECKKMNGMNVTRFEQHIYEIHRRQTRNFMEYCFKKELEDLLRLNMKSVKEVNASTKLNSDIALKWNKLGIVISVVGAILSIIISVILS